MDTNTVSTATQTDAPSENINHVEAEQEKEIRLWGCNSITVTIPARCVSQYMKRMDWDYRGTDKKFRPTIESYIASRNEAHAKADAKYSEDQAYNKLESAVMEMAKKLNTSPLEIAQRMGVQLREK